MGIKASEGAPKAGTRAGGQTNGPPRISSGGESKSFAHVASPRCPQQSEHKRELVHQWLRSCMPHGVAKEIKENNFK